MLANPPPPSSTLKQAGLDQDSALGEEVEALFVRWQMLSEKRHHNDGDKGAWFEATRLLLRTFRENRVFYPMDKHQRFYGYSRLARALANRPKYERAALISESDSILGMVDLDISRHAQQADQV